MAPPSSPPSPPLPSLAALERAARARLPRPSYDYYAGGAEDEATLRDNVAAWRRRRLVPRALVDVSRVSLATTVLGTPLAYPALVAPLAYHGLAHRDAEAATARGAADAGTILCVSTMANLRLEDVAAAAPGAPRWFQLYVYKDRAVSAALVRRAEAAGYQALVLTVDAPRLGRRERDVVHGFGLPPHLGVGNFSGAVADQPHAAPGNSGIADYARAHLDDSLTWESLAWLRTITRLPIIVKGLVAPADCVLAVEHGAAAIVVSNHGGRQLDGCIATADALAACVAAVAGRAEVYVDGGIRRGTDILRALALGARAVLIGRPILWGLAVGGAAGVTQVLGMLAGELELALALAGQPDATRIDPAVIA